MADSIDGKLAANLRRWCASGHPQQWCDERRGRWDHADRLTLLSALWWSEFWPMEPDAVFAVLDEMQKPWNLERWKESGQPARWVEAHAGQWDHTDWLALLDQLQQSGFWPLDPAALGAYLDEVLAQWQRLQRWRQSGHPAQWVASRQGAWNHDDWLALVDALHESEFWPLDQDAVGRVLEEFKAQYHRVLRWHLSGAPRRWVEECQGQWDAAGWGALLATLAQSEFWPLDVQAIERVVDGVRKEWWNLRRWRDGGLARRWVAAHHGQWDHDDWLGLLASLRASGYWPVDPAALGDVLEAARTEWSNLRRWRDSGSAERWLAQHAGRWGTAELHALFDELRQSAEFWPLDPRAVQASLEGLDRAAANLHRWQASGHAERWVAAHREGWDHAAWSGLLDALRASAYWPLVPDAVGATLEAVRRQDAVSRDAIDVLPFPSTVERSGLRHAA